MYFFCCDARPFPLTCVIYDFLSVSNFLELFPREETRLPFIHFADLQNKLLTPKCSPDVCFGLVVEQSRKAEVGRGEDKAADVFPPLCSRLRGDSMPEDKNQDEI